MTEIKPFKKGDKVKHAGGVKLVVVQDNPGAGAVDVESPAGVKPYVRTHRAADSLKRGH